MRWSRLLLLGSFFGCSTWATPPPEPHQPVVASVVATLLANEHYSPLPVDDELSRKWLQAYFEELDYNHMIFLQSDLEEFKTWETRLDDDILTGHPSLEAASAIHARYQQRLSERIATAHRVLDGELVLDGGGSWEPDRHEAPWPATAADADELWRQRVLDQVIASELGGRDREATVELLHKRYTRLEKEVLEDDAADVLELYLDALTRLYDPHSVYFKPATSDNFDIEISNSVEGIGAQLRSEGEYTEVVSLVAGGPAELDGRLKPGDRIVAVAQGEEPAEDVVDLRLDYVVQLIRGKKGSEVRLTVIPVGAQDIGQTQVINLVRDQVVLTESDADAEVIEVDGHKIGVLTLPSFYIDGAGMQAGNPDYQSASRDTRRLLLELEAQGVEGVVLDLRENGGGSLMEAVAVTGLFIDRGPVVQVRDQKGKIEVLEDKDRGAVYEGPLVVLTSPLSASASEIVAGAIQDYNRGLVVGARTTHGKGSVQSVVDLDSLVPRFSKDAVGVRSGALKITIQKFYRVSGSTTQSLGVLSDIELPSPWDGLDIYESDLDHALPWDEISSARYKAGASLDPVETQLAARSTERVTSSEDFAELNEMLAERSELMARKTVSLDLEQRRTELEANKALEAATEDDGEEATDFILMEAAAILGDWIDLGT